MHYPGDVCANFRNGCLFCKRREAYEFTQLSGIFGGSHALRFLVPEVWPPGGQTSRRPGLRMAWPWATILKIEPANSSCVNGPSSEGFSLRPKVEHGGRLRDIRFHDGNGILVVSLASLADFFHIAFRPKPASHLFQQARMMHLTPHRSWLMNLARKAGDHWFDPTTNRCLISRDTFWYAISLLFDQSEERKRMGSRLLASVPLEDCTHTPATLLAALFRIPDMLDEAVRLRLEEAVQGSLGEAALVELGDGNVNHPLAAVATLILGGERAHREWAVEIGSKRLKAFRKRIGDRQSRHRRQAEMSEYNSLTYTALDLWFLALIAEHAQAQEARQLALFLEQRLWVDVAMHFHAPSMQFAGPHSRSYQEDSLGGFSGLHCTMLAAFEDPLSLDPSLCERFDHPSALLQNSLATILAYHVPDEARALAWRKPFPYGFRMTTYGESYHENSRREGAPDPGSGSLPFAFDEDIYPGGWSDLTTYMTEEYALGSAALPYVNAGHADSLMLRIRRNKDIRTMADIRSMYVRGVFNGARVGEQNLSHVARTPIDRSFLYEEGRSAIYQHGSRAIVCYCPKRAGHERVTSFRLDLIFGYHAPFDVLVVNGRPVQSLPCTIDASAVICFRDFQTFGMIRPLPPLPAAAEQPVRLSRSGEFFVLSLVNYEGVSRDFSRHEINGWRSGFVLELATARDASWEEFLARVHMTQLAECVETGSVRRVTYSSSGNTMEFLYDPYKEVILSRRWNGEEESVNHMEVEAAGNQSGDFCPSTLYGRELLP